MLNVILTKIIKNTNYIAPLFDVCFRTNKIVIQTYQFLRLWILEHYYNNINIPLITIDTIKMVFSVLTLNNKGGNTPKGNNLIMLHNFTDFYNNKYKVLYNDDKINGFLFIPNFKFYVYLICLQILKIILNYIFSSMLKNLLILLLELLTILF